MKVWIPNNKNKLRKVLLGSAPTRSMLRSLLNASLPVAVEKIIEETHEDLDQIKNKYEELGVEVLSYPAIEIEQTMNVRNFFLVVDDTLYLQKELKSLEPFYSQIESLIRLPHKSEYGLGYCPDIYIHDDYAILDGLRQEEYRYWRNLLSTKRKIITAFNEGHSDGVYCNVADKIWLTNGNSLNFKKYWPSMPVMELSTTNSGQINHWAPVEQLESVRKELFKTKGRYLVSKHTLDNLDLQFIDQYLEKWVGYCEETLFDINLSIVDENNVIAISRNSKVYDRLEQLGIRVHKVPFRHRFFWDGGLHCITNDLVRD